MDDTYKTITQTSEGLYKEKMSKFLSFAVPCRSAQEALEIVKLYRNEYCDARHCCWAYMIGPERKEFRSNDDGEPSGTAGKPILGQINSFELTNLVVIVVRYFGGIKLGTSGLIEAYRTAAQEALSAAQVEERLIEEELQVAFEYPLMGDVMRIVKEEGATVLAQDFQLSCRLHLSLRRGQMPHMRQRFENLYGATIVNG
ncbi:MAG: YigZ family protein [Bacteroidales bacterium]|nr:YigZ family protein [Bacteroidales bacterium]